MATTIKKITYPTPELFDIIKFFYLGLQMGEHEFESNRDITEAQAELMFQEYVKTSQENSSYEYYIAFTEGVPSGFIEFSSEDEIENTYKKYLRINSIYVDSRFRNQGIATELLKTAEARARELGFTYVGLGVLYRNSPALNLYKKFGFDEYGIELMKPVK
ncbi:GNAT family N-acetyltransferase [Candidatus Woesebacteria bacterium]|nr:GNAT family N-acetyltransferase [Candidatus Woesebacteria bacterium]